MSKSKVIIWQKWVDPFGEEELPEILSSLASEEDEPEFYDEDDKGDKDSSLVETPLNALNSLKKNIKVISTPMGIVPVTENTASGKIFNFWVGHSNFNITKKIGYLIEETDGVETLDIFTRYRFRIGIGKAFKDSDVMRDINEQVYSILE